jgi:hypothetical protein
MEKRNISGLSALSVPTWKNGKRPQILQKSIEFKNIETSGTIFP